MDGAKDRVQQLRRALAAFQPQQVRFRRGEALQALGEEAGVELAQVN